MNVYKELGMGVFVLCFSLSVSHANNDHLDSFISRFDNKRPQQMGINCFATALAAVDIVPYSSYVDAKQFAIVMQSALCTEVKFTDNLVKGDILMYIKEELNLQENVVQKKLQTPLHAAIYLNSTSVFEKATFSSSTVPELTSVQKSLAPYSSIELEVLRKPRELSIKNSSQIIVKAYRCKSLEALIDKNYSSWKRKHQKQFKALSFIEGNLSQWTQSPRTSNDKLRAMTQRLTMMIRSISYVVNKKHLNYTGMSQALLKKERIWEEAPLEILQLYQMRFLDMIYQIQLILARNIREDYVLNNKSE